MRAHSEWCYLTAARRLFSPLAGLNDDGRVTPTQKRFLADLIAEAAWSWDEDVVPLYALLYGTRTELVEMEMYADMRRTTKLIRKRLKAIDPQLKSLTMSLASWVAGEPRPGEIVVVGNESLPHPLIVAACPHPGG